MFERTSSAHTNMKIGRLRLFVYPTVNSVQPNFTWRAILMDSNAEWLATFAEHAGYPTEKAAWQAALAALSWLPTPHIWTDLFPRIYQRSWS